MAYCRFSSDNWRSDVYAMETDYGFCTHVAANRFPADAVIPDAYGERVEWLNNAKGEPIVLPHAGTTIYDNTPGECADTLERLRTLGYNVPQSAIDRLRVEDGELICDGCLAWLTTKRGKQTGVCLDCLDETRDPDYAESPAQMDGP